MTSQIYLLWVFICDYDKPRQYIKKHRHHFVSLYSQSYAFSSNAQMWSWTRNKAEHWRIDAFELWSWKRLLRVPQTARRSNQSILKEINPEESLEGLILKLQCFGLLMWRASSSNKTLMLGTIEGSRRRRQQRMWWLHGITESVDMNLGKLWKIVKDKEACCAPVHGITKSQMQLSDWTTLTTTTSKIQGHI